MRTPLLHYELIVLRSYRRDHMCSSVSGQSHRAQSDSARSTLHQDRASVDWPRYMDSAMGGSLTTYATGDPEPSIPFWPLVFKNIRLFFLGSDDFPAEAKATAAAELNEALDGEWPGLEIAERFPLNSIAEAHELVERGRGSGRVVVTI